MKELNIIICDSDAMYAKALVQAFQRKRVFDANYIILTDQNKLLSYLKEGQALLYILAEEAYEKTVLPYRNELTETEQEVLEKQMFLLTEQAKAQHERVACIFKYQPVNQIMEPITAWICENYGELVSNKETVKIIGVMDYAGDSAALFGNLAAKIYAERGPVLLVNMELFPFQFKQQQTEYNLSDYIYAVSTGSDCTTQIASGMQHVEGNVHFVSPAQCFEDLQELKNGDISNFLKQLKEQCGCEYIVIVVDFLRSFALELLSGCDAIISCESGNLVSLKKREQFYQMLALEQKEWLLEKLSVCTVNSDYLLSNSLEDGEISEQARAMFYNYLMTLVN